MEIKEKLLSHIIHKRPMISHKGTFGRSVLIGGNEHYGGAIIMSALGAVHSGCGLTTAVTAEKNHAPLHARLPEAMAVNLSDQKKILEVCQGADVILIGPGLGLKEKSRDLLKTILERQQSRQWLVIDGSAITLFAEHSMTLAYPEHTVFTPHQMEWQRLSGLAIEAQTPGKNQQARDALGATIVLKSHRTAIYSAKEVLQNPLGTPAMATGGMGDTLAGMITGFLAQFDKSAETVSAAVFLHSMIAEDLARDNYVVLPTQISEALPRYMKRYER